MKYKLIFFVLIFHLSSFTFHPSSVQAEELILSLSPSTLQIQTTSPSDSKSSITLENSGNNSINIHVLFKPFRASHKENGEIEYINDNEIPDIYKKIFNQIHITDNGIVTSNFELAPKQKKNLEIQFIIPKKESDSDYYFSVIFLARGSEIIPQSSPQANEVGSAESLPDDTNSQGQNFSVINAGVALNVILSIGDKNNPQGAIEEFTAPTFIKSGPVGFTVRIKNIGQRVFAPKAIIFIKNMFGQTVGKVDIEPDNILTGSIRSLTDTQTASTSSSQPLILNSLRSSEADQFSTRKAFWPERFLLGPYTATLNLVISDKGPVYNQSIIFFAIPIKLILTCALIILITVTVFFRIKYHLKRDNH